MNDVELVAIVKALDSEIVKNLLSPIAKELGLTLSTFGEIFRFYSQQNLGKIFTKWAESRRAASTRALNANDFEKIMPLLILASTASEDELQTRWAALLESAVTDVHGFLPSFGRTLSELTAEEARYLDRIWKIASAPQRYLSEHRQGREPLSYVMLIETFDSSIKTGVNAAEIATGKMHFEQIANYERLGHAELVIQDLERLGILGHEPITRTRTGLTPRFEKEYSLTEYGVSFVRAVSSSPESPLRTGTGE
jgi:hypothetical protein